MPHSFQIVGLDHHRFAHYFDMSEAELTQNYAIRRSADASPGYPCRVSLEEASVGEELILLPYLHQASASPYRASGPIFVRRHARQALLPKNSVPPYVTRRLISVRAYDYAHLLVQASVVEGLDIQTTLQTLFQSEQIAYIHLHNAKQGCFSCQVNRV